MERAESGPRILRLRRRGESQADATHLTDEAVRGKCRTERK
jgi:hypothetical protein